MRSFNVTVNGTVYSVQVEEEGGTFVAAPAPQRAPAPVTAAPAAAKPAAPAPRPAAPAAAAAGAGAITAPMSGTIFKVNVKEGQAVKRGDVAIVLEAMKMENDIFVAADGVVQEVKVTEGASVQPGDVLVVIG
jgi:biotin carboxyl carrier protein